MTTKVSSESPSNSGVTPQVPKYSRVLIAIFVIWTIILATYTLVQQHGCSAIIWWQQVDQVRCWQTSVTPTSLELRYEESATVKAKVTETGYYTPEIHWTSKNEKIASLDKEEGKEVLVTAKSAGKTEISARIGLENKMSAENSVQFQVPIEVLPTLSINPPELRIKEGSDKQVEVDLIGIDKPKNKSIDWQAANPNLIQVDGNNRVKALKTGTTTLKAVWTQDPRVSQTIEVSVLENPPRITGIEFLSNPKSLSLYVGETAHLDAQASCQGNCTIEDTRVYWSSNHPDLAMISSDGDIRTLNAGEVTLTATSIIDNSQSRSTNMKVLHPIVTNISVKPSSLKFGVNSQTKLQAILDGRGDFNKGVSWSSENANIAQVDDEQGILTGVKKGKTKVEARSISNPNQVASVNVTVNSGGCSPGAAAAIGAVVTVGSAALLVPPPIAVVAGSAAASGICWVYDQVN
ncbi:Ig-like domain-containing protein [Spirulina subsalsa]|uniref:Ig-like domain-containing protein n=1 Tax=Spirulina subsalsa TaxID=54311 RepID=UPI0002FCD9D0|nr:Ig-like domain-containing protein [Spirulina subsalsa]